MTAGLSFKKNATDDAANLSEVKIITLTDGPGNEYTLDSTGSSLKLKYKPKTGDEIEHPVNDLVSSIRNLLTTKTGTIGGRETTLLEEEAGKSSVAKAVLGATSDPDGKKSILVEKLGGFLASTHEVKYDSAEDAANQTAKDFLAGKFPLVKTDGSNIASLTDKGKALASAILGVEYTDSDRKKRSVLVEKLGKSLDDNTNDYKAKYDGSNEQTAIDFLKSKGLEPASASEVATQLLSNANKDKLGTAVLSVTKDVGGTPKPALETNLAANPGLQTAVKTALAGDGTFKSAVRVAVNAEEIREVMSKPVLGIPEGENEPMCYYDPYPACPLGA